MVLTLTPIFALSYPVTLVACQVIKTYHSSKPLGMQTLLSQTIVIFVNILLLSGFNFAATFGSMELFGPFNETTSIIMTIIPYTSLNALVLSLLILTVTKYLSVYHCNWIANLDDNAIVKKFAIVIWLVPSLITLTEFGWLMRIQDTMGFHAAMYGLHHTGSAKRESILPAMTVLTMLAVAILQFRIELDRYRNGEAGGLFKTILELIRYADNNDNNNQCLDNVEAGSIASSTIGHFGYSNSVVRIFILLLVPVFVIIVAGAMDSVKLNISIGYIVVHAIAPLLIIWNHQGMRGIFLQNLRKILHTFS